MRDVILVQDDAVPHKRALVVTRVDVENPTPREPPQSLTRVVDDAYQSVRVRARQEKNGNLAIDERVELARDERDSLSAGSGSQPREVDCLSSKIGYIDHDYGGDTLATEEVRVHSAFPAHD